MNKNSQKLLDKAIELKHGDEIPLFKGIYIIQQRKLHDSGYRLMYVIGHTDYDEHLKDFKYYIVSCCSDVVDFTPLFESYVRNNYNMCDLHIDINRSGLIHIWTTSKKYLKTDTLNLSSCGFEVVY